MWPRPAVVHRERSRSAVVKVKNMSSPLRFDRGHTDDLMAFLMASPSPYHAVANAAARLEKAGFRQVEETDAWDGSHGREVRPARRRDHRLVRARRAPPPTPRSGSSAPTPTPPTCGSSRCPTPARTAGGRSPSRSTAGRCSTPGSTATSASPAGSPCATARTGWSTSTARCCASPSSPSTWTGRPTRRPQARPAAAHAADLGARRRRGGRPDRASSPRRRASTPGRSPAGT